MGKGKKICIYYEREREDNGGCLNDGWGNVFGLFYWYWYMRLFVFWKRKIGKEMGRLWRRYYGLFCYDGWDGIFFSIFCWVMLFFDGEVKGSWRVWLILVFGFFRWWRGRVFVRKVVDVDWLILVGRLDFGIVVVLWFILEEKVCVYMDDKKNIRKLRLLDFCIVFFVVCVVIVVVMFVFVLLLLLILLFNW